MSTDAVTWPCMTCGHPIRRRQNPRLGQAYYEHVYPVDNLHGDAVRIDAFASVPVPGNPNENGVHTDGSVT